ncbi:MAG: ESPR domain-containing protein, partial [Pseudomonadales bacterium]|nr:ESPR domain-containing protein [Pseudomonadales bacterium]
MDRLYKTIYNRALGIWQAVSELAKARGLTGTASATGAGAALLGLYALFAASP